MTTRQGNVLSAELWAAYLATRYEVAVLPDEWLPLTIGEPVSGMENCWQGEPEAFIVTAHNPFSQRLPPEENQRREVALRQRICAQGYRFLPTRAVDSVSELSKKWPDEHGVLIFGATIAAAIQLAAEFEQHALVRVPRVGVVECLPVTAGEKVKNSNNPSRRMLSDGRLTRVE